MAEHLQVTRTCTIALSELQWRFTGSGGPGGQHANTANTRVELLFHVSKSPSLGPRQKDRLVGQFGTVVRVVASERRSQLRNRELALERLATKLAAGLKVQKRRRVTKPTAAAKKRRIETKKRRGATKRQRRGPSKDDMD